MGLFRKNVVIIGGKKYSNPECLNLAFKASDAITLTGFSSAEELYNLLQLNCLRSNLIIDYTLKELADRYNERANNESKEMYENPETREAHAANVSLMDEKIKIICDVRTFIALSYVNPETQKKLPKFFNSVILEKDIKKIEEYDYIDEFDT